jgi:hypothetical protein
MSDTKVRTNYNPTAYERAIYDWLVVAVRIFAIPPADPPPIIYADQDGPRPTIPHLTLKVLPPALVGRDMVRFGAPFGERDMELYLEGWRLATASIQANGPSHREIMDRVVIHWQFPDMMTQLYNAGVSIVGTLGGIRDLSGVDPVSGVNTMQRSGVDLSFLFQVRETGSHKIIKTVVPTLGWVINDGKPELADDILPPPEE